MFRLEMKKHGKSRLTMGLTGLFFLVGILSPFTLWLQDKVLYQGQVMEEIGDHPFLYWLLMDSASWGFTFYQTLFVVLAVLLTGLSFYQEKCSSVLALQMTRCGRLRCFGGKIAAGFLVPFLSLTAVLLVNLAVTWLLFPGNGPYTEQYSFRVPNPETFIYDIYCRSPLLMAVVYVLINGAVLGLFSLFAFGVQLTIPFPNQYAAAVVPVILLHLTSFVPDLLGRYQYDLRMIMQPMAAAALTDPITGWEVGVTFLLWAGADGALIAVGQLRNRDVYR